MRFSPVSGQVVMESSGLMIALNATEPSSYDGWRERAIAAFHSRTPSPAIRNLVSLQTFQMTPLAHASPQTIPSMRRNAASSFEFSAVPSLLQRFPPPSHIRLLSNSPALKALGFSQPKALNETYALPGNIWKPCRIDSFGPLHSGTLYSGDGVLIQQPGDMQPSDHGCIATLRYPRSSFPSSGNMTFLWSSVFSMTQRGERRGQYQHSQETSSIHNIFFRLFRARCAGCAFQR